MIDRVYTRHTWTKAARKKIFIKLTLYLKEQASGSIPFTKRPRTIQIPQTPRGPSYPKGEVIDKVMRFSARLILKFNTDHRSVSPRSTLGRAAVISCQLDVHFVALSDKH